MVSQGKGRSSHGSAGPGGATGGVTGRGGVGAGGTALLGAEDVREEEAEGVVGVPPVPKRMKIIDSLVTYFVFFCSVSFESSFQQRVLFNQVLFERCRSL